MKKEKAQSETTQHALASVTQDIPTLKKKRNRWKEETETSGSRSKDLSRETEHLVSHGNKRQKIIQHIKVKHEII